MPEERRTLAEGFIKVTAKLPDGSSRIFGDNSFWLSNPITKVEIVQGQTVVTHEGGKTVLPPGTAVEIKH